MADEPDEERQAVKRLGRPPELDTHILDRPEYAARSAFGLHRVKTESKPDTAKTVSPRASTR